MISDNEDVSRTDSKGELRKFGEELEKQLESQKKTIKHAISQKENIQTFSGSASYKNISESIDDETKKIKNRGLSQDIALKKNTLIALFLFLAIETILIFIFAFLQATHILWSFNLEEWSFKLLLVATIIQITLMLNIAVKHLFPEREI